MVRRCFVLTAALAALGSLLSGAVTTASADSSISLESVNVQSEGVVVALQLRYTCDPGSGELGFFAHVSQTQGRATVTGAASGGFYGSEHLTCSGTPQSKVMYVPTDAGFWKTGDAHIEVYLYTCCSTASVITNARIGKQPEPPLNLPAGGSFITAADTGQLALKGAEVSVPVTYRCSGPVASWILYGTLAQKVGQTKATDDGDPFQAGPFEMVCDGTDHTATMFFSDLSGHLYEPEAAFLVTALEIYDGTGTYTAREYRRVRLTR